MYKNKIQGLRGRATGLVFSNFDESKHVITWQQAKQMKFIQFSVGVDTSYSSKSPDTIRTFSKQIVEYLLGQNVKLIVIACNTATSMALEMLRQEFPDIPIVGVIEPTVRKVVSDSPKNVGIIGTKATISSNIYTKTLRKYNREIKTASLRSYYSHILR